MGRVLAQGDTRPMNGNDEAMGDLRRILASRAPFYSQGRRGCATRADKTFRPRCWTGCSSSCAARSRCLATG
jgi:hypothetical protein